jgi:hypothetical protein
VVSTGVVVVTSVVDLNNCDVLLTIVFYL